MVSNLYRQLDQGSSHKSAQPQKAVARHQYKRNLIDSSSQKRLLPPVKRFYQNSQSTSQQQPRRERVTVDNFYKNTPQANLWSDKNTANLYTQNSSVSSGDIVIINVLGDLKNDISDELKRAFPIRRPKRKAQAPTPEPRKENVAGKVDDSTPQANKVYDRISSIVIDVVNKDYITVRGRKELLYHNKKHSIEIQALVHKKDITLNNYIKSDTIIEKQIRVIY
jgi:flagellar basal body L-ring protein FlgH